MTTYMTRAPLQPLENPHMMTELPKAGRRTSSRLADKEDAPQLNVAETVKKAGGGAKGSKSNGNGTSARAGSKRKPSYDEVDDGFAFTRTRAKKQRATSTAQEPAIEEEGPPQDLSVPIKRKSRRRSVESPPHRSPDGLVTGMRKSERDSDERRDTAPAQLPMKRKRKARDSAESKPEPNAQPSQTSDGRASRSNDDPDHDHTRPVEITFDETKIALPFADTPIIRKNRDMRRGTQGGSRRSSLGMRGRRASSLIDAGRSNALPHDEVESADFYKHIASDGLTEPRRMRQLLMWCGARALGDKPSFSSEDGNARLAAREIQSQLLKEFSTNSRMSDWFDRRDPTPPPATPKPNPKNLSNLAKIEELEQQIARLQTESQTWQSLLRPPPDAVLSLPPQPSNPDDSSAIDTSLLLDPNQKEAYATFQSLTSETQPTLAAATSERIERVNNDLEFEVDKFAANVHALSVYKDTAEQLAIDALAASAAVLEKRDKEGIRRAAGDSGDDISTREVLRNLSRVIDR